MELTAALLADAARVEGGKLYVHGGGWDVIQAAEFPTTHPTMSLAWVLRVEYDEALDDIPITVELLDEDNEPVGPRIDGIISAGHAPRQRRGTATFVPQTLTVNMVTFKRPGGYHFRITSEDRELGSVPFRLVAPPAGQRDRRERGIG